MATSIFFVVRLFWSKKYDALPEKIIYLRSWSKARDFSQINAERGTPLPIRTSYLEDLTHGLLSMADKNAKVDSERDEHLIRAKWGSVISAGLVVLSLLISFPLRRQLAIENANEQQQQQQQQQRAPGARSQVQGSSR